MSNKIVDIAGLDRFLTNIKAYFEEIFSTKNDLNDLSLEVQTNERVTSSAISDIYSKLEFVPSGDNANIATKDELNAGLDTKQDIINDLDTIRSGASKGATALQLNDVSHLATKEYVNNIIDENITSVKAVEYSIDDNIDDISTLNGYMGIIDVDTMNDMLSTNELIVEIKNTEGTCEKFAFHSIMMSDGSKMFKCDLSELNSMSLLAAISEGDGNGYITFLTVPNGSCEIFINSDPAETYNKVSTYVNTINMGLGAPNFILIDNTSNISDVIGICPVTVTKYGDVFLINYIAGIQGSITAKMYTLTKTSITLEDTTEISKYLHHRGGSGTGSHTEELIPGSYYYFSRYNELILTLGDDSHSGVKQYMVKIDTPAEGITISLPTNIKWANGLEDIIDGVFVPQPSCTYEISITGNSSMHPLGTYLKYNN